MPWDKLTVDEHFALFARAYGMTGGTQQRSVEALLDELQFARAGFDWETYLRFWNMSERRRDAGMGILIVSHLLTERERLDRIYTVRDGKTFDR